MSDYISLMEGSRARRAVRPALRPAPTVLGVEVESKSCGACGATFTRDRRREGAPRWAARKYCSGTCAGRARTEATRVAAVQRAAPRFAQTAPATPGVVWRPDAPGWPAQPVTSRIR